MFGTVARFKAATGTEHELPAIAARWGQALGNASGQIAFYLFKLEQHPGEYVGVAIFPDRATYFKKANDPETDRWYRRLRELLEADPEWNDGEILPLAEFGGI